MIVTKVNKQKSPLVLKRMNDEMNKRQSLETPIHAIRPKSAKTSKSRQTRNRNKKIKKSKQAKNATLNAHNQPKKQKQKQ